MKSLPAIRGFTLLELLTVITVIALLAALIFPVYNSARQRGYQTAALSNMRQLGASVLLYAGDNEFQLPGRVEGGNESADKWPKVLAHYLQDVRIYAAPGDSKNYLRRKVDPLSNTTNNTSFILNGYNDLGTMENPDVQVRINRMDSPGNTILLGTPRTGSRHFYMDFLEPPHGNNKDVLNLRAYGDGSNYFFADGSARFIAEKDYDDKLWLVDKTFAIPDM